MIFVTVGTDHHQFCRLLDKVNEIIEKKMCDTRFVIQYGLNRFTPNKEAEAYKFLDFETMITHIAKSETVITHASSTAMLAIVNGKVPIVVPRRKELNEVVDDHQQEFVRAFEGKLPMIVVDDIRQLVDTVNSFKQREKAIWKLKNEMEPSARDKAVKTLDTLTHKWFGQ